MLCPYQTTQAVSQKHQKSYFHCRTASDIALITADGWVPRASAPLFGLPASIDVILRLWRNSDKCRVIAGCINDGTNSVIYDSHSTLLRWPN